MSKRQLFWTRIIFASIAFLLALLRLVFYNVLNPRIDTTSIFFFAIAAIIVMLPWERLNTFKAGGVEISLDKPEVVAGLKGLNLINDVQLRNTLLKLSSEIEQAQGGRILWIDDRPYTILSERRLLRALNIETTMATSSDEAESILKKDNDFDLIITDMDREAENINLNYSERVHAGVEFIIKLRHNTDEAIKSLPVIFYSSYRSIESLARDSRPARELDPEAEISREPKTLLVKTIKLVAERRQQPIESKENK
jgi:CheY-like chemotaxis protein